MKSVLLIAVLVAMATTAFAQTDTTTTSAPTSAPPAATSGEAKRAQFCSGVAEREPIDELTTLAAPIESVTFFTELIGMAGKTITHKWSLDGKPMGEVPISVGADRWRCYSVKTLGPTMVGTWTVTVVDEAGTTLAEKTLTYTAE